jgi:hypothetical protein
VTTCSAVRPPQIQKNAAVKQAHARPGELNTRIAREFLYRQLNRLALCTPGELPAEPGIYAVFEPGQRIGARIEGLPPSRSRCMKIGMTNKTIRSRISSQYCGKSHRSAVPRMHVGDALIGQAIKRSRDLAGIAVCDLVDFRKLWNVPGSDGNVLKKHPVMCSKMGLRDANAVRALETPLESLVSDVVGEWRFVGIPASAADIDLIEDDSRTYSLFVDLPRKLLLLHVLCVFLGYALQLQFGESRHCQTSISSRNEMLSWKERTGHQAEVPLSIEFNGDLLPLVVAAGRRFEAHPTFQL